MHPCFLLLLLLPARAAGADDFIYDGFTGADLTMDGVASVTDGLLRLTNGLSQSQGHAFYPYPITNLSSDGSAASFSTTFVFAINGEYPDLSGHGFAFVLSPTKELLNTLPGPFLGLFNNQNNGNASNHLLAIEFDTILNTEFTDINDNHIGINVNSLRSIASRTAGYFTSDGVKDLSLISRKPMQVWVDYDSEHTKLNVTIAPYVSWPSKPRQPLLSITYDLSPVLPNTAIYAGFSSATGHGKQQSRHYILGWSLKLNGEAAPLNYSALSLKTIQDLAQQVDAQPHSRKLRAVLLPTLTLIAILVIALAVTVHIYMKRRSKARKHKHAEWDIELGPPSFKYKDLVAATNGFKDKMLLGTGGFGRVYKGVMPLSKQVVAIKRVSPESKQGMKEFLYKKAMSKPRETVQESYEQESRISDKDSDEEHATLQKQHEIMELDVDSNTNKQADSRVSMLLSESSSHLVNPVRRKPAGMVESDPLRRSSVAASSDDSSTTARDLRFELLEKITGGFSKEHEIGSGGYGKVYKGVLNGKEIAVKKLHNHWHPALDDVIFKNEFENLMRVRHQNIVELVGYCYEIRHTYVEHNGRNVYAEMVDRVLCFEYLQNGSLDKHLYEEQRGLDWCTRYKIIKGICEGLNYLHGLEESILHLDLKPANILLDENMVPKIADFGLSRLFGGTHTHITTNLVGTKMYMPPEYVEGFIITKKYDVFSLGVIIIQIMTGRDGLSKSWEMSSQDFIELVHQNWKLRVEATSMHTSAGEDCKQVKRCIEIALNCVETERQKRPTIGDIIHKLRETETMTNEVPMPFSQESGSASSSHFKTEMVQNWSQEKQRGGQVKDSSNQQRKVLQKQSGKQQKDSSKEQPGSLEKEYQKDTKKHAASGIYEVLMPLSQELESVSSQFGRAVAHDEKEVRSQLEAMKE